MESIGCLACVDSHHVLLGTLLRTWYFLNLAGFQAGWKFSLAHVKMKELKPWEIWGIRYRDRYWLSYANEV